MSSLGNGSRRGANSMAAWVVESGETPIADRDFDGRLAVARSACFDLFDNIHAGQHLAKHHVLAIEPGRDDRGDEELRSVGVGTRIGHGKEARAVMLQLEVFIGKLATIDGLSTCAVVVGEVTTLEHEVREDEKKRRAFEAEAFFAGTQSAEILRRLGHRVCEEFEGDPTSGLAVDVDVEEHCRVSHGASH